VPCTGVAILSWVSTVIGQTVVERDMVFVVTCPVEQPVIVGWQVVIVYVIVV